MVFERDTMHGHVYNIGAYIDGMCVANIGDGEALTVDLPERYHRFGVGQRNGKGALASEIDGSVMPNERLVMRLCLVALGYGGWKITQTGY
ncbi:hypothetical protein [Paraburkholderia xenovorans]|uniref:hypothetical protein n=1 Tax=Paraburkholderia xenovorans TaxID=36873 RepID=UPI0038B9CBFC